MPTYEYRCEACGNEFEKFQTMSAAPIRKCPKCGKSRAKRKLSTGAGLIFKGSGFYITDYRDSSYAEKAKADSGTAETKPATGDTKPPSADSKSTTKPESKSEPKKSEPKKAEKSEKSEKSETPKKQ